MKKQEILVTELRKFLVCSQPVDPTLDLGKPSCCFCFGQCLASALLLLATSFCNEKPSVAQGTYKVR